MGLNHRSGTLFTVRRRQGHYASWEVLFQKLFHCETVGDPGAQWRKMISARGVLFFIEFDYAHIVFAPLIVLRSLLGRKHVLFSIRSEYLLYRGMKYALKRMLFHLMRRLPGIALVSIHRGTDRIGLRPFFTHFIYDPQYWDLRFLDVEWHPPVEFSRFHFSGKPLVVFLGSLAHRKGRNQLLEFLSRYTRLPFDFLFAGKMSAGDEKEILSNTNCRVINRYIGDGEMFYLYRVSDAVYCYYQPDERPSGIFGRALQMGKNVIVKRGGFLDRTNRDYSGLHAVDSLADLLEMDHLFSVQSHPVPDFDESERLKRIAGFKE